jgi:hypothetical protein
MTTMTSYSQGVSTIKHAHDVEVGQALIWDAYDALISDGLNIPSSHH